MKVKIIISSAFEKQTIEIDTKTNTCLLNGYKKAINTYDFTDKLCSIVLGWHSEYINENILDGESFFVEIEDENMTKKYVGKNSYPYNYNEFLKLVKGVIIC